MNDLLNDITKPRNIKELFNTMLKIVSKIYDRIIPVNIKQRKNKFFAKMTDPEIITIQLLIEYLGKSQNDGYKFLLANNPNLVNYVERSRFNRLVSNLFFVIKEIRKNIPKNQKAEWKIIDSFPITVNKFGRAHFGKRLRDISSYGYCASKKEKYYGMKAHVIVDLNGNPIDYLLTKANVDDREATYELSKTTNVDKLIGDKGYVGTISEDLKIENDIELYALKRSNSKSPLPKKFRSLISSLRRRIETTFNQLIEHFDIERVRANSKLGFFAIIESKFLCFNLLTLINGNTAIANVIKIN